MTLATMTWQATVTGLPDLTDIELDHVHVTIELDEAHAPYIEATIRAALPVDVHLIDPRLDPRPRLELTGTNVLVGGAVTTVTGDLVVHEVHINAKRAELTVIARSDEALLVDLAHVSTEALDLESLEVVPLVEWALDQVAAELTTGTDRTEELENDSGNPPQPNYTNLVPNPSAEVDTTGWSAAGSLTTLSRVTTTAWHGTACIQVRADSNSVSPGPNMIAPYPPATAGETYTFSFYVKANAARSCNLVIRFHNAANAILSSVTGTAVALVANANWVRVSVTAVAPAGTAKVSGFSNLVAATTGQIGWWDGLMITQTAAPVDYFDGSTEDTPQLRFDWTATPNNSPSTRTWRPTSRASRIEPGQYLWDWLAPILQATGLRLYCDEARQWHLVPATTAVPGVVQVSGASNAVDADDSIRLAGDYCDSVVVRYRWRDESGQQVEAVDVAGSGGRTKVITYETPYPGPGAAAGVLDRAQGRGHAQQLTALADLSARPGMTVISIIEGLVRQVGKIAAVRFDSDGLMNIRTRGLMDTPITAWIFAEGEWQEQFETWATYTGPEE